MYTKCKWLFQK